jgi:replicative DNA helicase
VASPFLSLKLVSSMENEVPVKSIPANLEAERAVLGSLLIDPDAIIKVANFLRVEDFFRERHGWLYDVMITLHERREPLDFVTVVDELERRGQLEEIGGPAYITDLIGGTPTSINVDYYARIVERTALLRRLISAAGQIAELAYDESQEVGEVIDRAETLIFGVSEARIHRDLMPIRAIMGNVVDRIDFLTRNKDTLMGVPTGFTMLDRLLGGMQKSDLIILAARPAMGKCVTADTLLVDPDTGERHTIADLVARRSARLLTLDDSYRLRAGAACDFVDDGIKPVYRVKTALGREVKVTLSHPFLTIAGWRPLQELRVGHRIGVPRQLPVFGSEEPADAEVKVLAYLLADGCVTDSCPQFTNSNQRLRDDFADAVSRFPGTRVRVATSRGTRTPTVCVASDEKFVRSQRNHFATYLRSHVEVQRGAAARLAKGIGVSPASITHWSQGKSVPSPENLTRLSLLLNVPLTTLAPAGPATISHNAPNSLRVWLEEIGIWGRSAAEKYVPEFIFRVTRPKAALFLNRLFACDGSIYVLASGQAGLSYSTVSQKLARDVQHLLLRFGILARLRTRLVKYGGAKRLAYELRVLDAASIARFCAEVGAFGKEDRVARAQEQLQRGQRQTNLDTIPVEAWQAVRSVKGNRSWRSMFSAMGLSQSSNLHVDKRSFGRERMSLIADALQSEELKNLATGDIYWDTITAIEYLGEQQVYDLTVDETHNFVADDVLVHNTSLGINVAQNAAKRYNARVAIFSLEMSNEQLAQRLLSMETGIDSHRLRLGQLHEDEWPILLEAANVLAGTNIFIDDTPAASVNEIRTKCRRLYAEHGLDMVLIDYMQLMSGQTGTRNENRQQEISYISRSLKSLARELNVPVIALSQLSRAVESRSDKRPMLSDLRESGSIEQDADVVLFIYRDDYYNEDSEQQNIADVIVAKHRHGSTGTVSLYFRKELTQFRDLEIQRTDLDY